MQISRMSSAPYRRVRLGDLTPVIQRRDDGTLVVRARETLGDYPRTITDRVAHWAAVAPDRTLLAWRSGKEFERLSYGAVMAPVRGIAQALLTRDLSTERPLAILSGNSAEHLLLALAAQHAGIPYAPVSPAYSLLSSDFGTLKHVIDTLTPGLVFAHDRGRFARAIAAAVPAATEVVTAQTFGTLCSTAPTGDVERAHAAISPDSIAKILFTSGSTGIPKGVINTHRMLCANQQMILEALPFLADEPPVLVDWLPWHHTFGGNHNIGIAIYNGGSLYIDEGRPLPGGFEATVRNLREVGPTVYFNVPRGYEELARALRADRQLAERFFSPRLRLLFYAAASLSQHVADELARIAVETCGERVLLVTGLGSTETAPMAICRPWESELAAAIGLPVHGLLAKLTPIGGKYEVRVKGPNVMPGYWRNEEATRAAFDDEGFYRMGDSVRFADPEEVSKGLLFDGRLGEDFKLSTGTWVNVGPLRAKIVAHFSPLLRDAVITGHGRDVVGMLVVLDPDGCRRACPELREGADLAEIAAHPDVGDRLRELLATFRQTATGSSTRVERLIVLDSPLSLDRQEVTDKGSINQRAVLASRAHLVTELYTNPPPRHVVAPSL
jgi:feruloyl-CoA synthase